MRLTFLQAVVTRMCLMLGLVVLALMFCGIGGCAGDSARVHSLGPAMANLWPHILIDADIGIRAQENAAASAALGLGEPIGPGPAASKRESLAQMSDMLNTFNKRNADPPVPLLQSRFDGTLEPATPKSMLVAADMAPWERLE